jgi:hypothetical protein
MWKFDQERQSHSYAAAWNTMDVILRTQFGSAQAWLAPDIASLVTAPPAQAPLARILATDPPWRPWFVASLSQSKDTAGPLLLILVQLHDTAHPATEDEMRPLLQGLIDSGRYRQAFVNWVHLLPTKELSRVAYLYNGRFAANGSDEPFNWTIAEDGGGEASLGAGEAGRGLRVLVADRPDSPLVRELVALDQGDYELRGKIRVPNATRPHDEGWLWMVRCADTGQVLAQSGPMGGVDQWRSFTIPFSVPADKCGGQWLELRRRGSPSEALDDSPTLFDDFSLVPRGAPAR